MLQKYDVNSKGGNKAREYDTELRVSFHDARERGCLKYKASVTLNLLSNSYD
jgi:hypothetical protein